MKKTSPFLRALKPLGIYLGLFFLFYFIFGGDKATIVTQFLGLPWTFLFQNADLPASDFKLFLNFEAGVYINAVVIYVISAWIYSRKASS